MKKRFEVYGMTGIVELFIIHAKQNNIMELNKNDLRENFFQLKKFEKYAALLQSYEYDENNICFLLEKELIHLTTINQIVEYKDSFYIYGINTDIQSFHLKEVNDLVRQMVNDYIMLNMQKQKVKVG